jgi:hypothetical protein
MADAIAHHQSDAYSYLCGGARFACKPQLQLGGDTQMAAKKKTKKKTAKKKTAKKKTAKRKTKKKR